MDKVHGYRLSHRLETRRVVVKAIEYDHEFPRVRTMLLATILALTTLIGAIPYGPLASTGTVQILGF